MSSIIADTIKGRSGKAPDFSEGATVTGIVTATNVSTSSSITVSAGGLIVDEVNVTGVVTATNVSTSSSITIGAGGLIVDEVNVTGVVTATNVSTSSSITVSAGGLIVDQVNVSGVSTYTGTARFDGTVDVNNRIDVVGGANIDEGYVAGVSTFVGLSTFADGMIVIAGAGLTVSGDANFKGGLLEKVNIVSDNLSDGANVDVANGNVHYYSVVEDATGTPNLRWDGSTTLGSVMKTGDTLTVSIIYKPNNAGYYAQMTIDGVAQTEEWLGGTAPSSANSDGYDIITYQLIRTGTGTGDYIVLANVSNFT